MSQHPYLGYVRTLKNGTRVDTNVDIHRSRRRPAPQQEPKRGYECAQEYYRFDQGGGMGSGGLWECGDGADKNCDVTNLPSREDHHGSVERGRLIGETAYMFYVSSTMYLEGV